MVDKICVDAVDLIRHQLLGLLGGKFRDAPERDARSRRRGWDVCTGVCGFCVCHVRS